MTQPTPHATTGHRHQPGGQRTWVVTYCDMITILIACFICIVTFASRESEKHAKRRDALLNGTGGTGVVGPELKGLDRNAVVLLYRPPSARLGVPGSLTPPLWSDPSLEPPAELLRVLDDPTLGTLANSYTLRVPVDMLFQTDGQLSAAGTRLLHAIAKNVGPLPYDLHILADDPRHLARAMVLSQHFARRETIHPGRLGVGVREALGAGGAYLWLVFFRNS